MIHVVAISGLRGPAMPVVGYDAIAMLQEEQHLLSQLSAESGQPCEKTIGWTGSPVFVVNRSAIFDCDPARV